jgi:hypothetical protein
MTQRSTANIKMAVLLFAVILVVKLFDAIPWWSFIVPVLALGILAGTKGWKVSGFATGFVTGFVTWAAANLFFHLTFDGNLVSRVGAPAGIILLIASGLIGGLLTGLALYTGQQVMKAKTEPSL